MTLEKLKEKKNKFIEEQQRFPDSLYINYKTVDKLYEDFDLAAKLQLSAVDFLTNMLRVQVIEVIQGNEEGTYN